MFYKALQKRRSNENKNKKAFTLIELIVVIAIIGVLVAILVPTMTGFVDQAEQATADANARTIYSIAQAQATFGTLNGTEYTAETLKTAIAGEVGDMQGDFTLTVSDNVVTLVTYVDGDTTGTYPKQTPET